MNTLTSPAVSPAVRDIGGEICSAIFSSFVLLMAAVIFSVSSPAFVLAFGIWLCGVRPLTRFLAQGGNAHEFVLSRGTTRRDVFLRKLLPQFAFWPAGILFLLVLPQFQQRQDSPIFLLAMTVGFMISAFTTAFFRSRATLTFIGFVTMLFVAMIILQIQRDHLPSMPEIVIGCLTMAAIGSLLLVIAYRRFLTMEVV